MKFEKGETISKAFSKYMKDSGKANILWVNMVSEFYSKSLKSWLQESIIEIYSVHNEGKLLVEKD